MAHDRLLPGYPVYIPSKGRSRTPYTANALLADGCSFFLVVEPQEVAAYRAALPAAHLLTLPWNNRGLLAARNWIRDHAEAAGHEAHWQLDDNIRRFHRRWRGKRLLCRAGLALRIAELFCDRYENVGLGGLAYTMFVPDGRKIPPYWLNVHIYSCTLVYHRTPYRWRLRYNDDTDLCLQVLSGGWCTVLLNAFMADKLWTMSVAGGNTADLYQGDGRLVMARMLERLWPGVVTTKRRFQRPQHVIKHQWRGFDTPLRLKPGVRLEDLPAVDEFGSTLTAVRPVRSLSLQALYQQYQAGGGAPGETARA
jgi:hypothetical protein